MNSKVLNVLILLAMSFCCANSDIVSIVKSSTSTISNWYDDYVKSLWATFNTHQSVPPDPDIHFYESDDISYSPSIQDENVVLMDSNEVYFCSYYIRHLLQFTFLFHFILQGVDVDIEVVVYLFICLYTTNIRIKFYKINPPSYSVKSVSAKSFNNV